MLGDEIPNEVIVVPVIVERKVAARWKLPMDDDIMDLWDDVGRLAGSDNVAPTGLVRQVTDTGEGGDEAAGDASSWEGPRRSREDASSTIYRIDQRMRRLKKDIDEL